MEHTPTPWRIKAYRRGLIGIVGRDNDLPVCEIDALGIYCIGDSELILRACNNHAKLLEALKDIVQQAELTRAMLPPDLADSIRIFGKQAIAEATEEGGV